MKAVHWILLVGTLVGMALVAAPSIAGAIQPRVLEQQVAAAPMQQQSYTLVGFLTGTSIGIRQGEVGSVEIVGNVGDYRLGALTLAVTYDGSVGDVVACFADPDLVFDQELCNTATGKPHEVKMSMLSAAGITGTMTIARMDFAAIGEPGQSTVLDVQASVWADVNGYPLPTLGGEPPDVDGAVRVLLPPTPVPPTATPVPPTPTSTPIPPTPMPTPIPPPSVQIAVQAGEVITVGQWVTFTISTGPEFKAVR